MRTRRLLLLAGLVAGLALGGVGAAALPAGAATTAAEATVCDRLNARVAQVPAIRTRIEDHLQLIQRRIAAIADPARRVRVHERVQPRVDALRALDDRLARQVTLVRERCPV